LLLLRLVAGVSSASLSEQHRQLLTERGITAQVAAARGYETLTMPGFLRQQGFPLAASTLTPGLLIPVHDVHGSRAFYQYRPDKPRTRNGKPAKYELPTRARLVIDVPPQVNGRLADPSHPLWITESPLKADAAVSAGLVCIATFGVWGWRGSNARGGKTALADWEWVALNDRDVYLAPDSDVAANPDVANAVARLGALLAGRGATVHYVFIPAPADGRKVGLDDYLAAGGTVQTLLELADDGPPVRPEPPQPAAPPRPQEAAPSILTDISGHLAATHELFHRWLGSSYDVQALDAVLAAAAAARFGGDPPWLLVVAASGAAKTETVMPLTGADATVVSTITGEAALLSGTSRKERAADASGGLLRKIGPRGLLVVKDFTSILSMNRDTRAQVLAALREIYDGYWFRDVGSDGGQRLEWRGRVVLIGAVTTAWDSAHTVIAALGDRHVLVRFDSTRDRRAAGLQALRNVNHEETMRSELAAHVGTLIKGIDPDVSELTEPEELAILRLADLVTLARTSVERGYTGDPVYAHDPEMPTRFAKQLAQIMRGGLAIGLNRKSAFSLAVRCAGDSVPPLRLRILADTAAHPHTRPYETGKRLQVPRKTVDRVMQELHLLRLLVIEEQPWGDDGVRWLYSLAPDVERTALDTLTRRVARNVSRDGET
jgi:hypothetical protein